MKKIMIIVGESILVLLGCFLIFKYTTQNVPAKTSDLPIEETKVTITDLFIYGGKFNIEGYIDKKMSNISLVWYENKEQREEPVNVINEEHKTFFYTGNKINEGIRIDDLLFGKYKLLLKEKVSETETKYYTFNDFKFEQLDYYTMYENNKIAVYQDEQGLYFNVTGTTDNVYDIVIAPGHGGKDSGAVNGDVKEADQVLEIGTMVKKQLELEGYRVAITNTVESNKNRTSDPYDKSGEITRIYNSKAKYAFALHLNSTEPDLGFSGLEVYAPNNTNLAFGESLAKNVKEYAGTTYSGNTSFKVADGIYVRPSYGNDKYDVKVNPDITPFYYILRETGGLTTGSYNDGSSIYEKSVFYNKRVGVETYLLELGYIINNNDLNNVLNNKAGYVKGIVEAIKQNIEKN